MSGYTHTIESFKSSKDDFEIMWQKWVPDSVERVIVFQHGIGEHAARYVNLLNTFSGKNTAFYGVDARGHGKTGGKQGHVDQFQMYVDDLADLISLARSQNQDQKVFLLGHSMGGIIALQYALEGTNQSNLKGLLISSGGMEPHMDIVKKIKKTIAFALARVAPATTLDAGLDLNNLTHDRSVIDAYNKDPLVHGKISFQMAKNLLSLGKVIYAKASHVNVPTYIFHGTGDQIVSASGSQKLFDNLTVSDKTLKLYEGLYHETMNESSPDKEKVLDDLKEWVFSH